jgi:3',5'-cyclic AMP phosphodiesterase CpdA
MLDTIVPGAGHGVLTPGQLDWLDRTLAAEPGKRTLIGMHHPPFTCGITHMDKIALHDPAGFRAVIARHPQVERIICGHHHRPIVARVAQAIASISPSVAH